MSEWLTKSSRPRSVKRTRYSDLLDLASEIRPKHVIEIGTWQGFRAMQFMALFDCYYTGFDLFEDATAETDEKEKNVKKHPHIGDVKYQLDDWCGFTKYQLIRGDTGETLRNFGAKADFIFIDGGHSEETIKSDFENAVRLIKPGGIIALDDYYTPRQDGFGCNFIFDGDDYELELLPTADMTADRLINHIAVVRF